MEPRRRNHYDVTNRVCIASPDDVLAEVRRLLGDSYPQLDSAVLSTAFHHYTLLHAGRLPGYATPDTPYHDAQHGLDCTLGAARLIDGHGRCVPAAERISGRRALLGLVIALFHDAGYVRRDGDEAENGAAYTLTHVQRSAEFLERFLPTIGYAAEVPLAMQMVHFTGYERALDSLGVEDPRDRLLGFMIASSDLIVQTADRCYLEKCRDFLFTEFEAAGLAGSAPAGAPAPRYPDRDTLMRGTPAFNAQIWKDRLDGYFGGIHGYFGSHFSGRYGASNPYIEAIEANLARIRRVIASDRWEDLRLRPRAIDAACMRRVLGRRTKASVGKGTIRVAA